MIPMIEVQCFSCQAPYSLDPKRIPAQGMKMRCQKCSASFRVMPDGKTSEHQEKNDALRPAGASPAFAPQKGAPAFAPASALGAAAKKAPPPPPPPPPGASIPGIELEPDEDENLPTQVSNIAKMGLLDLPRMSDGNTPNADLPGVSAKADLPGVRGGADLPGVRPNADLPAFRSNADLPGVSAKADLPGVRGGADLPGVAHGFADLPGAPHADLPASANVADLPTKGGAGHSMPAPGPIDFSAASMGLDDDNATQFRNKKPVDPNNPDEFIKEYLPSIESLPPEQRQRLNSLRDAERRGLAPQWGELDLNGTAEGGMDPDGKTRTGPGFNPEHTPSGIRFGELDLGAPVKLEVDLVGAAGSLQVDQGPADVSPEVAEHIAPPEDRPDPEMIAARRLKAAKKRKWMTIGILTVIPLVGLGAGFGLSLTPWGAFGMYYLERYYSSAAGGPQVEQAIKAADKLAASDTYKGVKEALQTLSKARNQFGLNRDLLVKSLLQESLFQVRFGVNARSKGRAASIFRRLEQRSFLAPHIDLARAAYALSLGEITSAEQALNQAKTQNPDKGYWNLIAGEIAMKKDNPAGAIKLFSEASKSESTGARALWGLARAFTLAGEDIEGAKFAVDATLAHTPTHAAALIAKAQLERQNKNNKEAFALAMQAVGKTPIDGKTVYGSSQERGAAWTLIAQLYEADRSWGPAREAYDEALNADPDLGWALVGAGRVLMREQRYQQALARFEAVITRKEASARSALMQRGLSPIFAAKLGAAKAMLELGQKQQATALLQELAGESPDDPEIMIALGESLSTIKQYQAAEDYLQKAIKGSPSELGGYIAMAELYWATDRKNEIDPLLAKADAQVEKNVDTQRERAMFELKRGELEKADSFFREALTFSSKDSGTLFGLGATLRRLGKHPEAAQIFDELMTVDPSYPGLSMERGILFDLMGETQKAIESFTQALDKSKDDYNLRVRLAAAQISAGQLDEAEKNLKIVFKTQPGMPDVHFYQARVAQERGEHEQAAKGFSEAINLDGDRPDFHAYFSRTLLDQGNLGRALSEANTALDKEPNMAEALWVKGKVQVRSGAVADALVNLKKALTLRPQLYAINADIGDAFDQLRKLNDAIAAYKKALEQDPERGYWWYKLGRLVLDDGNAKEAQAALSKALAAKNVLAPMAPSAWKAEAHRIYADAAMNMRNQKEAIEHYKEYMKLAPLNASDRDIVKAKLIELGVE